MRAGGRKVLDLYIEDKKFKKLILCHIRGSERRCSLVETSKTTARNKFRYFIFILGFMHVTGNFPLFAKSYSISFIGYFKDKKT